LLGYRENHSSEAVDDFSFQDSSETGSCSAVQDDSRQLERLLAENRDHFRSQTYSSVAAVPPLPILDSLTVDEPNLLPVCDSEVVKSGEYDNGQIRQDSLCSGKNNARNENAGKNNDDIIRTHAAEENNARIFEVQVIKGALGLGFCIEGGRGSATGDRPVAVKRLFKGILPPPRRLCFHLCLSVRLSVTGVIQKLLIKYLRNFMECLSFME